MRAIKRSKSHEEIVRLLADTNHPLVNRPIFPTMRELMCFAAVLGFENDRKKEIDKTTLEIDGRIFENHSQTIDIMYLIALADSKNAEVLRENNEDECISIFEQYAEGGFQEIAKWFKEKPEDEVGDAVILDALQKRGYLSEIRNVDDAIHDVKF